LQIDGSIAFHPILGECNIVFIKGLIKSNRRVMNQFARMMNRNRSRGTEDYTNLYEEFDGQI
jgi:hypothetical protein